MISPKFVFTVIERNEIDQSGQKNLSISLPAAFLEIFFNAKKKIPRVQACEVNCVSSIAVGSISFADTCTHNVLIFSGRKCLGEYNTLN